MMRLPIVFFVLMVIATAIAIVIYLTSMLNVSVPPDSKVRVVSEVMTNAKSELSLSSYSCQEFLSDIGASSDGSRLLRSMMMIAWATGYAAAQQPETARADAKALETVAKELGELCSMSNPVSPDVTRSFASFIDNEVSKVLNSTRNGRGI